ncbi:hypothetical protein Rs2_35421 [Raphanus sativus]|nr:hypothetical protein Rs2_35421 [Raphanus sativus]
MTNQDRIKILHGTWVCDADSRWIFEPDIVCSAENYIRLHSEMTLMELLSLVKERLDITNKEVSVKLSYQYPEWVALGDVELDMPQYITDDTEVGVFVQMRRAIEEVDLYISIVRHSSVVKEVLMPKELGLIATEVGEHGWDNGMNDEEWHDFAISETPLTLPPTQRKVVGDDQVVPVSIPVIGDSTRVKNTIPHGLHGIEFREPGLHARNDAPDRGMIDKGKNKRVAEEVSDTNSDSDDAMIVPILR